VGVQHPFLVPVLDWVKSDDERFIVEQWTERVNLEQVLHFARTNNRPLPDNVFLNIAAQICNGLEALHGRPGKGTGSENVLHLGLRPSSVFVDGEGKVALGSCALLRSPLALPGGGDGPIPLRFEYLSPEQTHSSQKLTPASDIFTLGSLLYEMFTLTALFRAQSKEQTIQKVRRAEVTSQLLKVKERMPGLDKVLFRALSVNPRHRYQRAFVLREDLRGLMAGYSFANISRDSALYLSPLFAAKQHTTPQMLPDGPPASSAQDFIESATTIDADPMSTAAYASKALQERARQEAQPNIPSGEWASDSATELKDIPPVLPPEVEILDQDSEEISLLPEQSAPDLSDESLDTDLGIKAIFPPGGAESTFGFVSSPQGGEETNPPGSAPAAPEVAASVDPSLSGDTQFDFLSEEETLPPSAEESLSLSLDSEASEIPPPPTFTPPPPAPRPPQPVVSSPVSTPAPAAAHVPENWDPSPERSRKTKPAGNMRLAIYGLAAAAAIIVGLKLMSGGEEEPKGDSGNEPANLAATLPDDETPDQTGETETKTADTGDASAEVDTPPNDEPPPEEVAEVEVPKEPKKRRRTRQPKYVPPKDNYDDMDYFPTETPPLDEEVERLRTDVSSYLRPAKSGDLGGTDVRFLEGIGSDDDSYTQARSLLLMNAEANRDARGVKRYLDQLFQMDENRYNSIFLSKRARWYANNRKYDRALADAKKAEQHWARIPNALSFETKTEIFEVQAASLQGLFYQSEDDLELLDKAIRGWGKYAEHVSSRRSDLAKHADTQTQKLNNVRRRLQ